MTIRILCLFCILSSRQNLRAQSPELSLREFASGQIKKGVRSIGMGGDGATWGNYSLVYRDSSTALLDIGSTSYPNGNDFSFTAVGVTLPAFRHGFTLYAIALSQYAANIATTLKYPGSNDLPDPVHGDGSDQAVFVKAAMPLGNGFSAGVLVSYERSLFDAHSDNTPADYIRLQTKWVPSGGFGLTWQPNKTFLIGFRALFNNDLEKRIDNTETAQGSNNTQEYRLGVSMALWPGALIDIGGNIRHKSNQLYHSSGTVAEPNLGFEQRLLHQHLSFRVGVDETSPTAGMTLRFNPINIDIAYVHNLAAERVGTIFGNNNNSILATLVFDFGHFIRHTKG